MGTESARGDMGESGQKVNDGRDHRRTLIATYTYWLIADFQWSHRHFAHLHLVGSQRWTMTIPVDSVSVASEIWRVEMLELK